MSFSSMSLDHATSLAAAAVLRSGHHSSMGICGGLLACFCRLVFYSLGAVQWMGEKWYYPMPMKEKWFPHVCTYYQTNTYTRKKYFLFFYHSWNTCKRIQMHSLLWRCFRDFWVKGFKAFSEKKIIAEMVKPCTLCIPFIS